MTKIQPNTENKTASEIEFNPSNMKKWLLDIIEKRPIVRKVAIKEALENFKLTHEQLKDNSSDGILTRCKSALGTVLTGMINDGEIDVDADKRLVLQKEVEDIYNNEKIESFILGILKTPPEYTKKKIFDACDREFAGEERQDGKTAVHRAVGDILARLTKAKKLIKKEGGIYLLVEGSRYPNTDIGKRLQAVANGKNVKENFLQAINLKGGEFFEQFSVKILEKVLSGTYTVVESEVTGGSADNGIDGKISIKDVLDYPETVLIQARTRGRQAITLKEVREFYGAIFAENGTRGIFITTAKFHSEAQKFINRRKDLVGVDGDKVFEWAVKEKLGIKETDKGNFIMDEKMFLDIAE